MSFREAIEIAVMVIEGAGVAVIIAGAVMATAVALRHLARRETGVYERFRRFLGRSILLGLELLIAADIVRTVAVEPSLENLGVLAIIVAIRTFLSWSLELEISGRWPWQKVLKDAPKAEDSDVPPRDGV